MSAVRYRVVDVFSDRPLAGNALAVVLDPVAEELMIEIAREVNLSETTFVTPTGPASYDVRIFTPVGELPFAGHPSLGSAWSLGPGTWTQRSPGATVDIETDDAGAVMGQPDPVFTEVDPEAVAALGLRPGEAPSATVAEVGGTRHLLVATEAAISRLAPDQAALARAAKAVRATGVGVVGPGADGSLHARLWVAGSPVPEDPGTGSAAGAFALLGRARWGGEVDVVIHQGIEMGRPCRIEVHAEAGNIRVGGRVSAFAEGHLTL